MNSPTWMLKGLVAGPVTQKLRILSIEIGADGSNLSCPCSSLVADEVRVEKVQSSTCRHYGGFVVGRYCENGPAARLTKDAKLKKIVSFLTNQSVFVAKFCE